MSSRALPPPFYVMKISKKHNFITPLPPTISDVIYECSSRGFGGGLEQTFHMEVRDRDSGHLLQNLSNSASPIFTVRYFIVKNLIRNGYVREVI